MYIGNYLILSDCFHLIVIERVCYAEAALGGVILSLTGLFILPPSHQFIISTLDN
mgnify:CR=1 FL=1